MAVAVSNLVAACPIAEIAFILAFFKHKNINNAVYFDCNNVNAIETEKIFHQHNIRLSFYRLAEENYTLPYSHTKIGLVLNTTCDNWSNVFSRLDLPAVYKSPFNWLIFTNNLTSTFQELSGYPIEVDSEVTVAFKNQIIYIYEVYNTGFYNKGVFTAEHIGQWNLKLTVKSLRRLDLTGVVIKCTVVVTDPIINETFEDYLRISRQKKVDSLHKLKFFTLLKYLRDMYNFTYNLQRTNSWGYMRNGSFDGMVGQLQRGEIDLGGTPVFLRGDRAKFIDYCVQTWQSKPCFILRHPKHSGGFYTIYTRPLTEIVWFCIMGLLVLSSGALALMLWIRVVKDRVHDEDSSASVAVLSIWGAMCQQSMSITKGSTSMKILIMTTFVLTLTLYQYYNAIVVSTLLREPPKNIRTLEDLLKSGLKAGVEDVLYNKDYFKRTTDPIALKLYRQKITAKGSYNFFTPEYGMALVKKGGFAFHVDSAIAYRIMRKTFTERELCEAHEILLYPPQNMAAVVKKGSPYKEHLTYGIRKMNEAGLLHRLKRVWDEPKPQCVATPDSSVLSVNLREFSTAPLALAAGMLAATLVLIIEIWVHRRTSRIEFTL